VANYKLDTVAFRRHVLNAPWMVEEMHHRGEMVKEAAEAIAPVYEEGPHPGRYKAGFELESGVDGGVKHDRAYAIVRNVAPEALFVEYGTEHNPAHHTLTIALEAARL